MAAGSPRLEAGKERLWHDVCVECFWVPELSYPSILDDVEDKLRSLVAHRLVGAVVVALGLVRRFRARADEGNGIVINRRAVGSNTCWFGKLRSIAHCVSCHRLNEADPVVGSLRFVVGDLEEELLQELPDSREVGV